MIFTQIYKNLGNNQKYGSLTQMSQFHPHVNFCDEKLIGCLILCIFAIENNNEFNFLNNTHYERKNWNKRRYYLDLS